MQKLAAGVQALFALLLVSVLVLIWYSMIAQGWMQGRTSFSIGRLYCDIYMFIVMNVLIAPAALLAVWRAVQLIGPLPAAEGVRFTNRLFMAMSVVCFTVALYAMDPPFDVPDGPPPTPPSDESIEYPTLPLVDARPEELHLTRVDGSPVTLADFEGQALFLNFWATWCGFCLWEFPNIQRLYDTFRDDPNIAFAMVTLEDREIVEQWLASEEGSRYDFPIYLADEIPPQYNPSGWPTTFFIAPDGRTAFRHSGFAAWDGEKTQNFLRELAATGK